MKFVVAALLAVLVLLQYRLWLSDDGVAGVLHLKEAVSQQSAENDALRSRNGQLAAEVEDLKKGLTALEERARNDLGMVGANETFFQVVTPDAPPAAGATPEATAPPSPAAAPPRPIQQAAAR
jgi:cell division protein FtsB